MIEINMTTVKEIMTKQVIACNPGTSIKEAARLLYLNGITAMPVLDKTDKLVGIVSETDLVKVEGRLHLPPTIGFLGALIYLDNPLNGDEVQKQLHDILATKVEELMTKNVITIASDASVEDAAELILHKKVNTVPVVEGGRLVGIVSRADIVKLLAGEQELRGTPWRELAKKS